MAQPPIPRHAAPALRKLARGFPIVAITGPRQSGKTTLARETFPQKPYVSLEDPDERAFAASDARGFLARFPRGAILDEVQRAPALFSYLQTIVDSHPVAGRFVLTGSQQFGLVGNITQTLAGRVGLIQLLPFSLGELPAAHAKQSLPAALWRGLYPPLFSRRVDPAQWYANYNMTYVERDVRQIAAVSNLTRFQRFLKMCAARCGQILNLSSLGADCGISHVTARAWLTVLEAGYIVFLLQPYHANFGKRLIKSPKLYFYDTGLASYLLDIRNATQMETHAARGGLFESLIVAEWLKHRYNQGLAANAYFWRDNVGDEIDLVVEDGRKLRALEIKSGATIASDWTRTLAKWTGWAGTRGVAPAVVYGGHQSMQRQGTQYVAWRDWPKIL
ncbi:MAG: ATP-binding protein [Betaproteobacteria bacterium]|nr:ATP-binding protein [Betaproteobacteria bacterium]